MIDITKLLDEDDPEEDQVVKVEKRELLTLASDGLRLVADLIEIASKLRKWYKLLK